MPLPAQPLPLRLPLTPNPSPIPTPTPDQGAGPYPSQHSLFLTASTDETGRVLGPASDVFSLGALN